jgi:hypothetical protein
VTTCDGCATGSTASIVLVEQPVSAGSSVTSITTARFLRLLMEVDFYCVPECGIQWRALVPAVMSELKEFYGNGPRVGAGT